MKLHMRVLVSRSSSVAAPIFLVAFSPELWCLQHSSLGQSLIHLGLPSARILAYSMIPTAQVDDHHIKYKWSVFVAANCSSTSHAQGVSVSTSITIRSRIHQLNRQLQPPADQSCPDRIILYQWLYMYVYRRLHYTKSEINVRATAAISLEFAMAPLV